MDDIIELIKKQGFVNIPFGSLNLVYNEAKVHYDSMLIYPPYYSIDFIANEGLDTSDFISPKYNEWGSFVNIDNKIQYIPDAELIEKLNAPFYGLQPVPIKIHKSIKTETDNSKENKNKDSSIDNTANHTKVEQKNKQKNNIEKSPQEKKEKVKKPKNISSPPKEKIKKEKTPKAKKVKAKEQSSSTAENPIIEVTDSKKKKNKLPIYITIFILILVAGGTYYYENYINIPNEKFLPLNNKLDYKELSIVLEQKLYQRPQFDTMRYYLIIASKTTMNSAKKESAHYSSFGFSPVILYDSIIKRYRVAIDSFGSRDTVLMKTKLEEVRAKYRRDAWIMKKRIGNG